MRQPQSAIGKVAKNTAKHMLGTYINKKARKILRNAATDGLFGAAKNTVRNEGIEAKERAKKVAGAVTRVIK